MNKALSPFDDLLEKTISSDSKIYGMAGTGKTFFVNSVAEMLASQNTPFIRFSYIPEGLYSYDTEVPNHTFVFKEHYSDQYVTHSIDIDYLFSLDNFLTEICVSSEAKEALKNKGNLTWKQVLVTNEFTKLIRPECLSKINELIQKDYIDDEGDFNLEKNKDLQFIYIDTQSNHKLKSLNFLCKILQMCIARKCHILVDSESPSMEENIKEMTINGSDNKFLIIGYNAKDRTEFQEIYLPINQMFWPYYNNQLTIQLSNLKRDEVLFVNKSSYPEVYEKFSFKKLNAIQRKSISIDKLYTSKAEKRFVRLNRELAERSDVAKGSTVEKKVKI